MILSLSIWTTTTSDQEQPLTQPSFAFSKLTIETLEQGVKYVQS